MEVGRTPLSYTYTTVTPFISSYHATLSVEPTGAKTSKIVYTCFRDQEALSPEQRLDVSNDIRMKGLLVDGDDIWYTDGPRP